MSLARFFAKHLVFLALTMLVVSFLVFAVNEFSPGDVARKELGQFATQEQVDLLTARLGLDRPSSRATSSTSGGSRPAISVSRSVSRCRSRTSCGTA